MYFLRKLSFLNVDAKLLHMFYQSFILGVLSFCLTVWGGNNTQQEKKKVDRILKSAGKIMDRKPDTFEKLYRVLCNKKINKIMRDEKPLLGRKITFGKRSGRVIHLKSRTTRYFDSFLPSSIRN